MAANSIDAMDRPRDESAIAARSRATWMLVLVTVLWGLSFVLVKNWQIQALACPGGVVVASCTLIAWRMVVALGVLLIANPRMFDPSRAKAHAVGALIGIIFVVGFVLQTVGMRYASPALSAFITSLGSAWVPLIGWLVFRSAVGPLTGIGLLIGVIGTVILSWTTGELSWGPGEWLTLLSSIAFAVEILMLDRLGRQVDSAQITPSFLLTTLVGAVGVGISAGLIQGAAAASARWAVTVLGDPRMLRDVVLLGILATALAFYWMNQYQPRVSPTRAALIYLLEPLFATAFAVLGGYDALSLKLIAGGGLILAGNALVELPRWGPRRQPRQAESEPSFAQSTRILDNTSGEPCIGP